MNTLKKALIMGFTLVWGSAVAGHSVEQISETVSFEAPESMVFDPKTESIFVSNVAGGGTDYDNKGWITRLDRDGNLRKPEDRQWAKEGLHAPKGMAILGGTLYVADIQYLVLVDIESGKIAKKVLFEESKFLNDVAVSESDGAVFVSDTMSDRIYRFDSNSSQVTVLDEGPHLESPNGLLVRGDELLVAGWGRGMKSDWSTEEKGSFFSLNLKSLKKTILKANLGHLDGIQVDPTKSNRFYVSDWVAGTLYIIENGQTTQVGGFDGAADIGILTAKAGVSILLPSMASNKVFKIRIEK